MNIYKYLKSIIFKLILVCTIIVLTSCSNNSNSNEQENNNTAEENNEQAEEASEEVTNNNEVPTPWNANNLTYDILPYNPPHITPNVGTYEVREDLSNLYNAGQYAGFTKEQAQAIYEDGFVVIEPSFLALKLHQLYELPMYKRSPVFISVDSALHIYHLYYGKSLQYVESAIMLDNLDRLSFNLLWESIKLFKDSNYSDVHEELKFVSAYFLTACKLLDSNISNIEIPEEISSIAEKEINLIEKASDFSESPLLRTDLDYSQFTVRGHYTGSEKLDKYFKTMMWYGLCGFPIFDESKEEPALNIDSLTKGMIITCISLKDEKNFEAWESIYNITSLYTGASDDLGLFEIRDLIANVYGKNPDINIFKNSSYHKKLLDEAVKLPEPKIKPKTTEVNLPAGRQFRFMGQRYSFDAEILQYLMEPIKRPVPSGLDVVAAFGSTRAEGLLDTYYKPKDNWDKYEENLNIMREKNQLLSDDEWKKDLYKGWLWSIKSSSASFENVEGMPQFMRSKKWTDKNIHTALGSYAELKHDSILYVKQPVAEMGGGPDFSIPLNYVEPNVEVYAKLKWLAENTKKQLESRDMFDNAGGEVLDSMIKIYDTLLNVSIKELTNEDITEEENTVLYRYGGHIDYIIQALNMKLMKESIGTEYDVTSALIADIATIAPNSNLPKGRYLEIGNGLPLEIYAVCRTNGKTYLAKGALFNYYEFLSDKRLTDREWQEMIGIKRHKWVYNDGQQMYIEDNSGKDTDENTDYFEEVVIERPNESYVAKPTWTNSFITPGENYVTVDDNLEFEWWK